MASRDWDILVWQRASSLLQQAERIQRNFLQVAVGNRYRSYQGRNSCWEPPVNLIETEKGFWIICAIPGVTAENVNVRLEGRELIISGHRPLPECCRDGELKLWELPLGRFERRLAVIEKGTPLSVGDVILREGLLVIEVRKN